MSSVNTVNANVDRTIQIFDRFYGFQQQVQVDEYDAVNSYFQSVFKSRQAAASQTVALFRVSYITKIPVMTLLQEMQGQSGPQLTLTLAFYLNNIRSRSTLLGLNVPAQSDYYVAHNIRI